MLVYQPHSRWGAVLRWIRGRYGLDATSCAVDRLVRLAKADARWAKLEARAAALSRHTTVDPFGPLKFLALDYWLTVNATHAVHLGLPGHQPLRILDLGTGSGLFPFLCGICGHHVDALDRPVEQFGADERLVYPVMSDALELNHIERQIEAFTPLSVDGTYDLITAFMVCFNRHKQPDEWGRAEWTYFLGDLRRRLRPGGRLCMRLNNHTERYGTLRYWSADIRALFEDVGYLDDTGTVIVYRDLLDSLPARRGRPSTLHA